MLQAAGGTMSSSRLIKKKENEIGELVRFSFDDMAGEGQEKAQAPSKHFQPMFQEEPEKLFKELNISGESAELSGTEEPEEVSEATAPELQAEAPLPEPSSSVTEEELDKRIHEAFSKGLEDGKVHAEEEMSGLYKTLNEAVGEMTRLHEKINREAEDDLLKLAMAVARKVIQQEISIDRRIVRNFVSEALKSTSGKDEIVIRLNPEDYKVVSGNTRIYLPELAEKSNLTLKPDDAVTAGGCIVDTSMGSIDARVEAQLEEIYRRLVEERGSQPHPSIEEDSKGAVNARQEY